MKKLRVGVAQIHNSFVYERNLECITRAIEVHAAQGTELVLFPECATTGYNTGMLKIDEVKIREMLVSVQALAKLHKVAVALPTPWPTSDGNFFNSVIFIGGDGEILRRVDKAKFQRGEDRMFTLGAPSSHVVDVQGYRVGLIICIESMDEAWTHLKKSDDADFVFWPGFYGPTPGVTWGDYAAVEGKKLQENFEAWGVPIFQATCASSPESEYWTDKVFGGSPMFNGKAENIFSARTSVEDNIQIELLGSEITSVKSLTFSKNWREA